MINKVILTGFLTGDPIARCSPGGSRRLDFDIHTEDSRQAQSVQKVFVDETNLMQRLEAKLEAGSSVVIEGELTSRPYDAHGVTKSYVREIRALKVDITRGRDPRHEPAPNDRPAAESP